MTNTFLIVDTASGRAIGTQVLADQFAPVLQSGQAAVHLGAGVQLSGSFTATGGGASAALLGNLTASLWGTFVGTVQLQRSFDGGTTWIACTDEAGAALALSAPGQMVQAETEPGVLYRLNCTAYTSGTIAWQIAQ